MKSWGKASFIKGERPRDPLSCIPCSVGHIGGLPWQPGKVHVDVAWGWSQRKLLLLPHFKLHKIIHQECLWAPVWYKVDKCTENTLGCLLLQFKSWVCPRSCHHPAWLHQYTLHSTVLEENGNFCSFKMWQLDICLRSIRRNIYHLCASGTPLVSHWFPSSIQGTAYHLQSPKARWDLGSWRFTFSIFSLPDCYEEGPFPGFRINRNAMLGAGSGLVPTAVVLLQCSGPWQIQRALPPLLSILKDIYDHLLGGLQFS